MRNPQRNDVYKNADGAKVVINSILDPNLAGVQFLEYKQIGSPELYFVPVQEFVEQFEFVETFASFDIYIEERRRGSCCFTQKAGQRRGCKSYETLIDGKS